MVSVQVDVLVEHIRRMGEQDNLWTSGVTGPYGPYSKIFYDFYPKRVYSNVTSLQVWTCLWDSKSLAFEDFFWMSRLTSSMCKYMKPNYKFFLSM